MHVLGPESASVIIINWNGRRLLEECLVSLMTQSLPPGEVIVVDNGSSDGSPELVRNGFPDVQLVELPTNMGFSRAANVGIDRTQGKYIALLNNDTEPAPDWLSELVMALDDNPDIGFCASKMVLYENPALADACGDFYAREGIPGKIGHLEPENRYNKPREVFGACAGAALYRREVLDRTGGFDEDFFIIHEDSDLSFRARLLGYRCLYVPTAVVRHHLSATLGKQSGMAVYYAQRNMEFVFFKNMPTTLLLKHLPLHLMADILLCLRYICHGQGRVFLKAKLDAIAMLPKMLQKRRAVQAARRISASDIDRLLARDWFSKRLRRVLRIPTRTRS